MMFTNFTNKVAGFLISLSTISADITGQTFQWAHQMGGTDWDKGIAIAVDGQNNVYTTGNFFDTIDFDPGPASFNLIAGSQDVYISKFDASGNFIWAKQIGGMYWEEVNAITTDSNNNIFLVGSFLGITDFDPSPATFNLTSTSSINAFICKLDSSGNLIWVKQLGGTLAVNAYGIAVDDTGNVYTTGYFDGTADFDPGAATHNLTVVGYSDIFVCKMDVSGNLIWVKQLAGGTGEVGYAIDVDDSGNVYSTGTFFGTVDFDPDTAVFNLSSPGQQEIYLSKLDASGNFVWAKHMGGEVGYALTLDRAGNVYFTGYYGWTDIAINKLDGTGNLIWTKQVGSFLAYSMAVDNQFNVYTTGEFAGTKDFDPGLATYNLTAIGSTDSYIGKLDSSGNFMWAKQLGGTGEVHSHGLALDGNNNIYTTGYFNETADFDPSTTTFNLTAISSYDIFVHKLEANPLNVPENSISHGYKIYPNPTNGNFTIELENDYREPRFTLKTITGQTANAKFLWNGSAANVQFNGAKGTYILEIAGENRPKSSVIILKK